MEVPPEINPACSRLATVIHHPFESDSQSPLTFTYAPLMNACMHACKYMNSPEYPLESLVPSKRELNSAQTAMHQHLLVEYSQIPDFTQHPKN